MTTTWKRAVILSTALALASCSGTPYQTAPREASGYESGGIDKNWVWAGLALGLLAAFSMN